MRRPLALLLLVACVLATTMPARAASTESVLLPAGAAADTPRAPRLAAKAAVAPLAALEPARVGAREQVAAIALWNRSSNQPTRNGFARSLAVPRSVDLATVAATAKGKRSGEAVTAAGGTAASTAGGGLVWSATVRVAGAHRLRLHLRDARLPPTARLWVYADGSDEEVAFSPGPSLAAGELWTPSIGGGVVHLEVELPAGTPGTASFVVDQVIELFPLDAAGVPLASELELTPAKANTTCLRDASCYGDSDLSVMEVYRKAVARLDFVMGNQAYTCSGGLLNDTDEATTIPYLLTAHHCVGSQAVASTLEAYFDDFPASCGGQAPALASLPRVHGATLLATGEASDFSLLQLSTLPPGRGLLGWTDQPVTTGTELHRLSHPQGLPQQYSISNATMAGQACTGAPRPKFLYSVRTLGGLFRGSSGSPVVRVSDGKVVGQAYGTCGPTAMSGEGCDANNYVIDGALSASFPELAPFLAPVAGAGCVPGPTTLCLGTRGRFRVEATFDGGSGQGQAQVVPLTPDSGYIWFFDVGNIEVVVKVLDACAYNQRFWVYAAGLTDVGVTLRVTDTHTLAVRTYVSPKGQAFLPVRDVDALPTCGP